MVGLCRFASLLFRLTRRADIPVFAVSWSKCLKAVTGFADVSLQPNAGSQGEYAGLRVIGAYHRERGEGQRITCLIPLFCTRNQPGERRHGGHAGRGSGL